MLLGTIRVLLQVWEVGCALEPLSNLLCATSTKIVYWLPSSGGPAHGSQIEHASAGLYRFMNRMLTICGRLDRVTAADQSLVKAGGPRRSGHAFHVKWI